MSDVTSLYRHFDKDGKLLYVGVSLSWAARLNQHKSLSHWFGEIKRVEIEHFPSRADALIAETLAIRDERPAHNIQKAAKEPAETADETSDKGHVRYRLVNVSVLSSVPETAAILGCSPQTVSNLIAKNLLGHIVMPWGQREGKRMVTGWQILEFIEQAEAKTS